MTPDRDTIAEELVEYLGAHGLLEVAVERALSRWWTDRRGHELGGRFVPPAVIRRQYDSTGSSVTARHAGGLASRAEALGWSVDLRSL